MAERYMPMAQRQARWHRDSGEAREDLEQVAYTGLLNELGLTIGPAFRQLPKRQQEIVRLRFFEDLTQSEIAGRLGISQMHVSRLLRRSIDWLSGAAA